MSNRDRCHQATKQTKKMNAMGRRTEQGKNHPTAEDSKTNDFNAKKEPPLERVRLEAGEVLSQVGNSSSTLYFLLKGSLQVIHISNQNNGQVIGEGSLFFIPVGEKFHAHAMQPATLLSCPVERFQLPTKLKQYCPASTATASPLFILPIHHLIEEEACSMLNALPVIRPDAYSTYLSHKISILLILIEHLYAPEEIALLFAPLLGRNLDFREKVLKNYSNTMRVKDLSTILHIPPSTLNRKFKETFQMSAKEWFTNKRREDILHDILQTELSIVEIADKYELTPNYLMKLCKDDFGMTLTELRHSTSI
ncbi:helix-turn-helix domain-containing protein [Bacteroidales bacterium SW292]|nr:helix-turn-helix domain-containing protein [Bacteroidales bacterium SW292]